MKVFVVNLERAVERRQFMAGHLDALGLDFEFFRAVEGRCLEQATYLRSGGASGLTTGEVGCALSHQAVWSRVVAEGISCALVLEDDALVDREALDAIRRLAARAECFDMVRLSALEKQVGLTVAPLDADRRLVLPTKSPSGAAGYLVSLAGARRLLDQLTDIGVPIDTALDAYWQHDLNVVMMVPAPVRHRPGVDSMITASGREGRSRDRRFWPRISHSLRKRMRVQVLARRWAPLREAFRA